jgi:hypothetical protein
MQAEHGCGGVPMHLVFLPRQRLHARADRLRGSKESRRDLLVSGLLDCIITDTGKLMSASWSGSLVYGRIHGPSILKCDIR